MIEQNDLDSLIPDELIASKVLLIRGNKVMLDADLAELYGVATKSLNQAVKRNVDRFPSDFMFRLTNEETRAVNRSQIVTGPQKHRDPRYPPYVFTEHGVAMLSSVLRSKRAVKVNIQIIRTFTKLREMLASNAEIRTKIKEMDGHIQSIYKILGQLLTDEEKPKRQIGFRVGTDRK